MASQMSIYAAQFSDEHLDASVAISQEHTKTNYINWEEMSKNIPVYSEAKKLDLLV